MQLSLLASSPYNDAYDKCLQFGILISTFSSHHVIINKAATHNPFVKHALVYSQNTYMYILTLSSPSPCQLNTSNPLIFYDVS